MRCVVTGVAGFIGSHLAEALVSRGETVVGVDCFTPYYSRMRKLENLGSLPSLDNFRMVEGDLRDLDVMQLLDGADVVFHLAGQPGVRPSWGPTFTDYVQHNLMATQRLLEAARYAPVRRFVYASSSSVYGNATTYPTTESTLPQPFSPYGTTKLAAEHLCRLYAANWGVPTVSLRYFTVYGPRQRPDMAAHRFIRAALDDQEIELYGTGDQRRDFTHVHDVVRATLQAASRAVPAGTVLNIAGGSHESVNGMLATIAELLGRPLRIQRSGRQAGDVAETRADCALAERLLHWRPTISLREGLVTHVAWLSTRPTHTDPAGEQPTGTPCAEPSPASTGGVPG